MDITPNAPVKRDEELRRQHLRQIANEIRASALRGYKSGEMRVQLQGWADRVDGLADDLTDGK